MDKLIEILKSVRDDVDFENETALIDDEILDSFDIVEIVSEISDEFDVNIGKSLAMLRLLRAVNRAVVRKLAEFDIFVKERTIELNKACLLTDKISKTHARNFNYSLVQEEQLIETNFF